MFPTWWMLSSILHKYNNKDVYRIINIPSTQVNQRKQKQILEQVYLLEMYKIGKSVFQEGNKIPIIMVSLDAFPLFRTLYST